MENLIGISIADTAEEPGIGQDSLECVIATGEHCGKGAKIDLEHIETARIKGGDRFLATDNMERGSPYILCFLPPRPLGSIYCRPAPRNDRITTRICL